jgi:hypothetical protein
MVGLFFPLKILAQTTDISNGTSSDERLSQAVVTQNIVLDDASKASIVSKCQNAQSSLKLIQNDTDRLVRARIDTYSYIQDELQAIKLRMIRQGADASEADLLTGRIQQALDQFTLQADHYGTSLDDVVGVDCQQKPEQFKAGLIIMRLQRAKLLDDAINLKNIINNSDSSIFNQLKKRLTI